MRQSSVSIFTFAMLGLAGPGSFQPAAAQQTVEEIVVTTGFRPERLADTVGSTSIIDSVLIEARAAEHLEAVVGAAANVTMTSGSSRGRFIQIRGVGDLEQFVDPKHYSSVGVSIDGIDVGGIASAAMLFDVDQIEILRGPQGLSGCRSRRLRDGNARICGRGSAGRGPVGQGGRPAASERRLHGKRLARARRHQRLRRDDAQGEAQLGAD